MSEQATEYFLGLDLGPLQEFTALAVLERPVVTLQHPPHQRRPVYALRHLERFPPGTPYPDIFAVLMKLMQKAPLSGSEVVVDQTGVGRPVVKLLLDTLDGKVDGGLWRVTLTAGHEAGVGEQGGLMVPKRELVGTVQVLLQSRRLRIAGALDHAGVLLKELEDFRAKTPLAKEIEELDWRDRPHDDLVLALALAAWLGEITLPGLHERFEESRLERVWT